MPPPVRIEDCLVDLHPVACGQRLRLKPGHTNLEIDYTAFSFIKPEQIHFDYKLQGLDRQWVKAGTRRSAYYPHLPPGKYAFIVIAANSDGVWNNNGASLPVIVLPPYYRTWWFLTLASLIAAAAVVLAWQHREGQLKHAHAAQEEFSRQLIESQERERQRIASGLHDSLGQTMLIIKNRANLALKSLVDRASAEEQLDEISASALAHERPSLAQLTPAERHVLALLTEYRTSEEIAATLGVSVRTIENHRANICTKLEMHGHHALVKFAIQH